MAMAVEAKSEVIKKFQAHSGDTGSSEVQIALLTNRIDSLTEHFKSHVKDHSSRRGLIMIVNHRRRLLSFLKKHNRPGYSKLVNDLGIRG